MARNVGVGLFGPTRSALLVVALLALAALFFVGPGRRAEANNLCGSTGSPLGPFGITTYEAADYKNTYARTLELAGTNSLFPGITGFALPKLETGDRALGSGQLADGYVPPVLLKAIAYNESSWAQASFSPLVDYGEVGPVLASHDCGYGIMQVTTGMQNVTGIPNLDQAMIGTHYAFNIARGAKILADKWNMSPEYRPVIGSRDPALVENWYYAIWGYNGWAFQNHPLNPSYSPGRTPFSCGPTSDGLGHDRSQYPYQEIIMGCAANPPFKGGVQLWAPQEVHLPDLNDPTFSGPMKVENWNPCTYSSQCTAMDIPTPNTNHKDPSASTLTREQVIGAPAMAVSREAVGITVPVGGTAAQTTVTVSNSGSGLLGFRATSTVSWLKVSPNASVALGQDLGGDSTDLTLNINTSGLPQGKLSGQVKVDSLYGGSRVITVNLTNGIPDGAVIAGSGPAVYKVYGSVVRHVPDLATFSAMGLSFANVITVPDSILNSYTAGAPILSTVATGRLIAGSGPAVYVMDGGVKRHIVSIEAMTACGYSFGAVTVLPDGVVGGQPEGAGVDGASCPRFAPPDGTLLRGGGPEVYVMRSGVRRHVPSLLTFEARGYRFENVDAIPAGELSSVKPGNALPDVAADGNLIASRDNPAVYVMAGGTKRHVADLAAMSSCGYGFDAITWLSSGSLNAIPESGLLTGAPCPQVRLPAGSLIAGSGPAIYVIDSIRLRRHVSSLEAFGACGYEWGNVDVVGDSVVSSFTEGGALFGQPCP